MLKELNMLKIQKIFCKHDDYIKMASVAINKIYIYIYFNVAAYQ